MGKRITRLSPALVSHLRSSSILSNVAQIAEELVCNSLDAGATTIEIAVDGEACHMKVDDDGCGISRDDLTLVGERHATSKLHCLDELEGGVATLGFRGEALSSLSNVSLVEITSRCRGMPNTYRKILKGGATLSIGLSGEQRTHGTTVVVRDMFYNQPVRRRLLNSSQKKILQSVKECVMRYVLIHPQVSFTVKDLSRKDIILQTKSAATMSSTLCNIFGAEVFSKLQEIDYAQGHLRLTGFLSKAYHSHPSKALQYFYINRRYVLKTALHKLINSYGGKSKDSLGRINFEEQGARGEMPSGRHLCPAFVLNLICPFSDYDITFEASKTLVEFKEWGPVVTFVRNIIQKTWVDPSVGYRQGFPPESTSAAHVKKTSSNDNIHHHKNFKQPDGSKDEIPPMAVRRALVQIDSPHPRDYKKDHISKHTAALTSEDILEKSGTSSKRVLSFPSGKNIVNMEPSPRMNSKGKLVSNNTLILQTDCGSDSRWAALPKTLWHMTPCRQPMSPDQPVEPFPAILGSDRLSDVAISPESEEQTRLRSGNAAGTFSFCKGGTSLSMPGKNQYESSFFSSERLLRSSSSPTDTCKSPLERFIKKSKPGRSVRLKGDDEKRCLFPVEGTHEILDEKWWDPDYITPKTPLSSPSNDSVRIPRILDTSDFLPEVSSCSPERTSSGGYPSHEWKWPEFDSDHSENEINYSSRMETKRRRASYASDSGELSDFFSTKSFSFDSKRDQYLGSLEINKPKYISWKLDTKDASVDRKDGGIHSDGAETAVDHRNFSPNGKEHDEDAGRHSDGTETAFQESIDDRILSLNGEEHADALQRRGYGFEMDSHHLRSKRRLDLNLDTSSDNLKLHSEHCEKHKPGKPDTVHGSSASQINYTRRGYSGPPFYRPPKRHGVHVNPPNSLSTVERMENIPEDGVATRMEPDTRSRVSLEAVCGTNQKRAELDVPQKRIELMEITTIQPRERGRDCISHSTHAMPCLDQEELEKHKETVDTSEVDRPLDVLKSLQQTVEVDVHQHCKHRSSDVNNADIDGAELPVDTVKAMFKEWSNPCMKKDDDILDLSSGILASSVSSLLPGSITKDIFKLARVLQQVDTKFIASVSCGVLLLIDQHAADERVRLEELRKDILGGNITKQISLLSRTQQLVRHWPAEKLCGSKKTMTFTEQQTLQTYSQQIQDWGWRFKITEKPTTSQRYWSSTGGTCKVLLSAVPSILGVRLTGADLVEYLQQLTDTQGSSTPPPAVIRLLNNKACRGAIMFGDKLLPTECNQLVNHLKKTLLCFQCAHGRPTMIPLVDIHALHKRFDHTFGSSRPGANIDSDTGKAHSTRRRWHGLQPDFKPNLERAQARLAQA